MFLSHYVDMGVGPSYYVDHSISNSGYYSAWITDEDRNAYDAYLSGTMLSSAFIKSAQTFVGIANVAGTLRKNNFVNLLREDRSKIKKAIELGARGWLVEMDLDAISQSFNEYIEILQSSNDARLFVKTIKSFTQGKGYEKTKQDALIDIFLNMLIVASKGSVAVASIVIANTFSFAIIAYENAFNRLYWLALVQYNPIRVTLRIRRYYGL